MYYVTWNWIQNGFCDTWFELYDNVKSVGSKQAYWLICFTLFELKIHKIQRDWTLKLRDNLKKVWLFSSLIIANMNM